MTDDLEALQLSLKRLLSAKDKEGETRNQALTVAMQGVQAALTELISLGEKDDAAENRVVADAAERIAGAIARIRPPQIDTASIAQAIAGLRMPELDAGPIVDAISSLRPDSQGVDRIVAAIEAVRMPDVNLTPQMSLTLNKGTSVMTFKFTHTGPYITGGTATITRE